MKPKEGMPSIRILAKDLAVSVITTKRAYEELEKEGVIESIPGRGFYVCEQKNDHLREKQRMNIEGRLSDLLAECKSAGKRVNIFEKYVYIPVDFALLQKVKMMVAVRMIGLPILLNNSYLVQCVLSIQIRKGGSLLELNE